MRVAVVEIERHCGSIFAILLMLSSAAVAHAAQTQVAPAEPVTSVQTTAAQAPAIPPVQQRLNLASALDLAQKQNLDLAAVRMERDITAAGIRSARELSNPSVSFSATRDEPHESLFFDEPIEIAGQRGRRIDVAQQEARLTDLQISTLERQIRRQVREAFYGAALALAKTAQRVEARDLATRLRDIAQARFQAGDVPQLEVFQAELEVSRADAAYQVAGEEEKIAWSQLDVLLGEAPETVWEIQGSLEDETSPMTLDQLLARAGQSSPELQNLAQELEVEDKKEALLSADRVPDLVLEGGVDFNSPHDFKVGARGQVTMDVPLFSRNQGEIAAEQATEREMQTELLAARRSVNARVEQAYFEFEARRTEIDLDRTTLLPAGRHLESLAEDSYKAGKSDILSVLDAQRDVQQLEGDYLDNLFAFQSAFAELEEAVGEPLN